MAGAFGSYLAKLSLAWILVPGLVPGALRSNDFFRLGYVDWAHLRGVHGKRRRQFAVSYQDGERHRGV